MSSTRQATSSTERLQSIIDALANYKKVTGIEISTSSFVAVFEQSNSPEDILRLLQGRLEAFQEYRNGNRKLISCLKPAVQIIQSFSKIIEEAVSLVHFSPAKALFVGIETLLEAASAVTSSYDALINLFESLENFLKRLEIYTTIPPTPIMTDMIIKIMLELLSVFALATKQIKQGRFMKFAKKLLFKEREIENVLERLDRLTHDEARATIAQTFGAVHGLVGNMREVMEGGEGSMDTILQAINEINKMRRDQLRWNVKHWLSPPDPSTNHNVFRKAQHSGTAAWFFEGNAFTKWKAEGSLLWIHGKLGSGKSTLLSAIIQNIKQLHEARSATMAYYYFDFRDAKKQDYRGLLSSLILQLAADSDSCYDLLSQLYSDHTHGIDEPYIDSLKKCMTDMLSLSGQAPIYIIVDALDETPNSPGNPSAREEVLELIEELVQSELPNLHLCVASRPETDVRMVLGPLASFQISLHDESGQKQDILTYIKSVVGSDKAMQQLRKVHQNQVVDTLSQRVDGVFQWVVCQVDTLRRCFPADILGALDRLPENLDETYARVLLGIDKQKAKYARRLFRCLWVSIRPLRVEELADIFAVQFDAPTSFNEHWRPPDTKEALMSACSSLITIVDREGHQVVQFSHISVKEYLTSEQLASAERRLSYYHILPNQAHTILAHACLGVLLQLDDKIDKNTIGRFPLASYAARHWVDHAQFGNVSSHIQEAMARLFDPARPHFAAWVWLYDVDHHWIEPMSKICPTRPEAIPLYYASLCGFPSLVEHLIDAHSPDVNSRGGSNTTALHAAVVNGHSLVASLLLRNGADPNSRDQQGRTPLHRASRAGQIVMVKSSFEIAQFLVKYGANVNVTDDQGGTPLHAAARCGDRDIAQLLIESRASLDVRDNNQQTPLHVACANGKLDVSRLLIYRGSDINSRDTDQFVPLHMASRFGHTDIARLLLERGSDVNVCESQLWTPLHYASRTGFVDLARVLIDRGADVDAQEAVGWTGLHIASATGDLNIAELLIDSGASVDSRNSKQNTALDLASGNAKLEMARFLIGRGATVSSRDDRGWTPFHTASYYGHLNVAKLLLERNIDVDIRTENEETPLYLASNNGKVDVVRFLINEGANIHVKDKNGWNAVHVASDNGHLDIVRQLIDVGTPVDIPDGTQNTPLTLASRKGNVEVGRFLVERGADINARDKESRAPLHFAAEYGHLEMARLLLDQGVDVNVQKCDPWSPLHLASTHGHLELVKLLLCRGANVDVLDQARKTAAELTLENGHTEVTDFVAAYKSDANIRNKIRTSTFDTVQYDVDDDGKKEAKASLHAAAEEGDIDALLSLLERGADVKGRNTSNQTPLDRAARKGNADVVRLLIERGAGADSRDKWGWTPLHYASRYGHLEVSRLLINNGANVDARKHDYWTPIHLSANNGHLGTVKLLLERGADAGAINDQGETPHEVSLQRGYPQIVNLLREHSARGASL